MVMQHLSQGLLGPERHTWRILNFCYAFITSSLPQKNTCSRGVRKDMTPDRFTTVSSSEKSISPRIALNLVRLAKIENPSASLLARREQVSRGDFLYRMQSNVK